VATPDGPSPEELTGIEGLDPIAARARAAVAATGAPFDVVTIDPDHADTAEFCARYGYGLEISANCLLVATREDPPRIAACMVLATTRLDVNRCVRGLMGVRKLSFAPAELTIARTGMQLGGVTPFGLDASIPLYVDARIAELERVIVGGGSRSVKLFVAPSALVAIGGIVVEDLALEVAATS